MIFFFRNSHHTLYIFKEIEWEMGTNWLIFDWMWLIYVWKISSIIIDFGACLRVKYRHIVIISSETIIVHKIIHIHCWMLLIHHDDWCKLLRAFDNWDYQSSGFECKSYDLLFQSVMITLVEWLKHDNS